MIFLSASIPDEHRNKKYFDTADVIAIRDAVRALATVVIPNSHLVWGGHPAITPLIRYVMKTMGSRVQDHITLYQSDFFRTDFPIDNQFFEKIIITPAAESLEASLEIMRSQMLSENKFQAAVFIGGMDGVEVEYQMFKRLHPQAIIFPVASTGAAAKVIFDEMQFKPNARLSYDYAYMALFRSLFNDIIKYR